MSPGQPVAGSSMRSVSRTLAALEAFAATDRSVGVTELARKLRMAPSSAHRLLQALVCAGYARPEEGTGRYRRGPSLLQLWPPSAPPPQLREVARPILRGLVHATGETAHLAILDGSRVVTVDHVAPGRIDASLHPPGSHLPAHATALGLALLARRPDLVEALLAEDLVRWAPETIVRPDELVRRLEEVRRRGYAVNRGGWREATAGVAAPIVLDDGRTAGALGLSGPAARIGHGSMVRRLGPLVARAAGLVAARLDDPRPRHPVP